MSTASRMLFSLWILQPVARWSAVGPQWLRVLTVLQATRLAGEPFDSETEAEGESLNDFGEAMSSFDPCGPVAPPAVAAPASAPR